MVPSTVSNRKMAEVLLLHATRSKAVLVGLKAMLKTVPVGLPCDPGVAPGMVTTSGWWGGLVPGGWGTPWPLYRVLTPAPLSETQKGLVPLEVRPQGLIRLGSKLAAMPGMSEVRLVCTNAPAGTQR